MIRTPPPEAEVTESDVVSMNGMTHFVSVAYAKSHFAVLVYEIEGRAVMVYDGINFRVQTWMFHVTHTLRKYGLQRWDSTPHVEVRMGKGQDHAPELCYDDLLPPWVVSNDPIIKQHDEFNCEPIACLKVMEIYGILPKNSIAEIGHQELGYRSVVMDYYERFLLKYDSDLQFILDSTGVKRITKKVSSLGRFVQSRGGEC
jgi:hypothetical protein